jgi:3-hydroxyisobutyrate dehydrogenase-like beta-hydroxyacid dehydrogenase
MALSAEAGIPADKFLELAGGEEAWRLLGRVMDDYVAMTGKGDYSTREATLEVDAADYGFFIRLCWEMGVDSAFHEMIETAISSAIEQGRGDQAIPAIFEVLSRGSNL